MIDSADMAAPQPAGWQLHGDCAPLFAALSQAQGQCQQAQLDAKNPHFRTRYASIAACWAVAKGPLAANGLAFAQLPTGGAPAPGLPKAGAPRAGAQIVLISLLTHTSGAALVGRLTLPPLGTKNPMQQLGSHLTYARRAVLCGLLGITAGDDNDANTQEQQSSQPAAWHAPKNWRDGVRSLPAPQPAAPPAQAEQPSRCVLMWQAPADPSWQQAAGAFTSQTDQLLGPDTADRLAGWCIARDRPRPRAMHALQRSKLLDYLRSLDDQAVAGLLQQGAEQASRCQA